MEFIDAIGASLREALTALALTGCALLWLRASRGLRSGPWIFRLADGFLLLSWVAIVSFYVLAGIGVYRPLPAIGLTGLGGAAFLVASRAAQQRELPRAKKAETSGKAWTSNGLSAVLLVVAAPTAILAAVRLLKSLVAPSLAWDAMTYHLPKAAMWVQSGSLALPEFPDAWSYYAWYPGGSEILWSWLMLATRDDNFIGPLGCLIWVLIAISAARVARVLGASETVAWMMGVALVSLPPILSFMTAAYADSSAVLFQLLAVTHALEYRRSGRSRSALQAAAAAGVGAAVKITGLVLALPTIALLVLGLFRHARNRRFLIPLLVFVMLLPGAGYLRNWIVKGSPVYPSKPPLVELLDLPYHLGLERVSSGRAFPQGMVRSKTRGSFQRLFWEGGSARGHLNFGLGGLVLSLLAAAAVVKGLATRRHRGVVLFLLSGALLVTPLFFGPSTLALRTIWSGLLGRLLISACAAAFVCASLLPRRVATYGLGLSIAGSLVHALPLGWSRAMLGPAAAVFLTVIALSVAFVRTHPQLFEQKRPPFRTAAWVAALVVVYLGVYVGWDGLRNHVRYSIYSETGENADAFDVHALHRRFPTQVPLWSFLDTPESKRIAVAAGWEGTGPNQFLFPLLGSRLQNRLTYVPITRDGRDSELWHTDRGSRADARAWLARVEAVAPDYFVGLAPDTPEREWVERRSDKFEFLPLDDLGENWLARPR